MSRHISKAIAALASFITLALAAPAFGDDDHRLSGPYEHENLAIYFVHGESAPGPTPLTLQEAMEYGDVIVQETGSVNELIIENVGKRPVFVQSGDIVRGGRQDRTITASLMVPPRSGEINIAAYCVESGRWSGRGNEAVDQFASSRESVPSREARLAMRAPDAALMTAGLDTSRQSEVWGQVETVQAQLTANLGESVSAASSPTSLQLSMERSAVRDARATYVAELAEAGRAADDILGHVVAINGEITSADLYPSNALFGKMWAKNLRATSVEALRLAGESSGYETPGTEAVEAFLASVDDAASSAEEIAPANTLNTRETENAIGFEAEHDGEWVHRNYLSL